MGIRQEGAIFNTYHAKILILRGVTDLLSLTIIVLAISRPARRGHGHADIDHRVKKAWRRGAWEAESALA
jgi:hypothetical protein